MKCGYHQSQRCNVHAFPDGVHGKFDNREGCTSKIAVKLLRPNKLVNRFISAASLVSSFHVPFWAENRRSGIVDPVASGTAIVLVLACFKGPSSPRSELVLKLETVCSSNLR